LLSGLTFRQIDKEMAGKLYPPWRR